ncbi:MAG TPA: FAD-dependent oxidoreductase, partial [Thermoleophilia bacterium]|nr:FAD-dependent oxidoreductase [Thermoleophilia bacterium]
AVIGAGLTGLSAALTLARKGASVVVFDTHCVGWGASSRNAGMVSGGGKRGLAEWIADYGRERAHAMWRATHEAVDYVDELIRREKIDCDWAMTGAFTAAWKAEHFGQLAEKQRFLLNELGHETVLVAPMDVLEEVGTQRYYGGLVEQHAGVLDPARYVRGMGEAAKAAGAHICELTTVQAITPGAKGRHLTTSRGTVDAGEVLVATNGYTGEVTPRLRRFVVPIGSHLVVTEPLNRDLARRLIPHRRMVADTKHMLYYFRLTPDDRMMFGGRAAYRRVPTVKSGAILRRRMLELFPELAYATVDYAWDGFVGFTLDWDPVVGRFDRLFCSLGYCGHGVALATYLGDRVARTIAGESVDNPFFGVRAPLTNPVYRGRPWFVPLGDLYYRAKDKVR